MERFGAERVRCGVLYGPASSNRTVISHPLFLRPVTAVKKGGECDHTAKPLGINKH